MLNFFYVIIILVACLISVVSRFAIPIRFNGIKGKVKVRIGYKITLDWIYCEITVKQSGKKRKNTLIVKEIISLLRKFIILKFSVLKINNKVLLDLRQVHVEFDKKYIVLFDECIAPHIELTKATIEYDLKAKIHIEQTNGDLLRLSALYQELHVGNSSTGDSGSIDLEISSFKSTFVFHTSRFEMTSLCLIVSSSISFKCNMTVFLNEKLLASSRQISFTYAKSFQPQEMVDQNDSGLISIPESLNINQANLVSELRVDIYQIDVLSSSLMLPLIMNFIETFSDFLNQFKSNSESSHSITINVHYALISHEFKQLEYRLELHKINYHKIKTIALAVSRLPEFEKYNLPLVLQNQIWLLMNTVTLSLSTIQVEAIDLELKFKSKLILQCHANLFKSTSNERSQWDALPNNAVRLNYLPLEFATPDTWMASSKTGDHSIDNISLTVKDFVLLRLGALIKSTKNDFSVFQGESSSNALSFQILRSQVYLLTEDCKIGLTILIFHPDKSVSCDFASFGDSYSDILQMHDITYSSGSLKISGACQISLNVSSIFNILPILKSATHRDPTSPLHSPIVTTHNSISISCLLPIYIIIIHPLDQHIRVELSIYEFQAIMQQEFHFSASKMNIDLTNHGSNHLLLSTLKLNLFLQHDIRATSEFFHLNIPNWNNYMEPCSTGVFLFLKAFKQASKSNSNASLSRKISWSCHKMFITIEDDPLEAQINLNYYISRLEQIRRQKRLNKFHSKSSDAKLLHTLLEYMSNYYIQLHKEYKSSLLSDLNKHIQSDVQFTALPLFICSINESFLETSPTDVSLETFGNLISNRHVHFTASQVVIKLRNYTFPLISVTGQQRNAFEINGPIALTTTESTSNEQVEIPINNGSVFIKLNSEPVKMFSDLQINVVDGNLCHGPGYESALRYVSKSFTSIKPFSNKIKLKWFDNLKLQCHGKFTLCVESARIRVMGSKFANQMPITPDRSNGVSFLFKNAIFSWDNTKSEYIADSLESFCANRNRLTIHSEYLAWEVPIVKQIAITPTLFGLNGLNYSSLVDYIPYVEINGATTWIFRFDFLSLKYTHQLTHDMVTSELLPYFSIKAIRIDCEITSTSSNIVLLNPYVFNELNRYLKHLQGNKSLPIRTGHIFSKEKFVYGKTVLRHVIDVTLNVTLSPFTMKYEFDPSTIIEASGKSMLIKVSISRDLDTFFGDRNCQWLVDASDIQWHQISMTSKNETILTSPLVMYFRNTEMKEDVAKEVFKYQNLFLQQAIESETNYTIQEKLKALKEIPIILDNFQHLCIIHDPKIRLNAAIRDDLYKSIYLQDLFNGVMEKRTTTTTTQSSSAHPMGSSITEQIKALEEVVHHYLMSNKDTVIKKWAIQMIHGQIKVETEDNACICSAANVSINGYVLMQKEDWLRSITTLNVQGFQIHVSDYLTLGQILFTNGVLSKSEAVYYYQKCNPLVTNDETHHDFWSLNFPSFHFNSNSIEFKCINDLISQFVLYKDPQYVEILQQTQAYFFAMHLKSAAAIQEMTNTLKIELSDWRLLKHSDQHAQMNLVELTSIEINEQCKLLEKKYYALMRAASKFNKSNSTSDTMTSAFKITADQLEWIMSDQVNLVKMTCRGFDFCAVDYEDLSRMHVVEIKELLMNNLGEGPFQDLIAPLSSNNKESQVSVGWKTRPAVAGIGVVDCFELTMVPTKLQMTWELGKKLVSFVFTEEKLESFKKKQPKATLTVSSPSMSRSSSREIVLTKSPHSGSETESLTIIVPDNTDELEIELMRLRATANRTFYDIKINSFQLCISYIGQKEHNFEDLNHFLFTMPMLQYKNKTWTYLDLLRQLRKDVIKTALSHTGLILKEKLMRRKKEIQNSVQDKMDSGDEKTTVISTTAQLLKQLKKVRRGSEDQKEEDQ